MNIWETIGKFVVGWLLLAAALWPMFYWLYSMGYTLRDIELWALFGAVGWLLVGIWLVSKIK